VTAILDKDGFLALIASLTSLSPGATFWALDPNPTVGDQDRAQVKLEVFNMSALGVDEHRRHVSDGTDGYPDQTWWVQEIGNRHIVINVRAEAFDRGVEASEIIERIRTLIRADSSTALLNGMRLAYVWSEKTVRLPTTYDQRVVNAATADFTFAGISNIVSEVVPQQGWITTVNGNNIVPGTITP
jgi:hypothetical protein